MAVVGAAGSVWISAQLAGELVRLIAEQQHGAGVEGDGEIEVPIVGPSPDEVEQPIPEGYVGDLEAAGAGLGKCPDRSQRQPRAVTVEILERLSELPRLGPRDRIAGQVRGPSEPPGDSRAATGLPSETGPSAARAPAAASSGGASATQAAIASPRSAAGAFGSRAIVSSCSLQLSTEASERSSSSSAGVSGESAEDSALNLRTLSSTPT